MQVIGKDYGDCIHNYKVEGKKLCSLSVLGADIECDSTKPEADLCEDFEERTKIGVCRICHKTILNPDTAEDGAHKDCVLKQNIQRTQHRNRFDGTGQDDEEEFE